MGNHSQSAQNHDSVSAGQLSDKVIGWGVHFATRSLTLQAMYQSSEIESGCFNHGSLLSVICPFGGRGLRAAIYFRRATRAAKSSCKRRIDG
jgi:hypothetical protein